MGNKEGSMNRILHTMLRVTNLNQSITFYTEILGMRVLRVFDQPEQGFSLTFLGYEDESQNCAIELTYNYGIHSYQLGNAFGHIAIMVDNCFESCKKIKQLGGEITREAGLLKGSNEIIAFVKDPDGYSIELIQKKFSHQV